MINEQNCSMLCDFYQLTMGNGYFRSKHADRIAYFDMFFRRVPDGGGFAIAAGLEQVIDYLQDLKFDNDEIEFLRSMRDILGDDAQFCLDIKQSIRSGYDPFDLINEFSDNIKHCHISDHSLASDCLLPLNGKFNFPLFFEVLKQKGYSGAFIIEVYKNAYHEFSEVFDSYEKLKENFY